MISGTSLAKFSSKAVSSPWFKMTTSTSLTSQTANTNSTPKRSNLSLCVDGPPDLVVRDGVQKAFQAFLVIIHPGAKISHYLVRPTILGAIQFQHLLLPLQVGLLVMTGHPGISPRLTAGYVNRAESLRLKRGQVVTAVRMTCILPARFHRRNVEIKTPKAFAASPMPTNLPIKGRITQF